MVMLARAATAQTDVTWAADATVGLAYGRGGDYVNRSNPLVEFAVSARRDVRHAFGVDAEIGYDWSANIDGHADLCVIATTGGGCLPDFPAFSGPLALLGVTLGTPGTVQLRLNAGLAAYAHDQTRLGTPVASMDVAAAPTSWLAIVVGGRAFVVPNYLGDRLSVTTWRLGLRLQR